MKTRTTSKMFIALLLAFLALGASNAQALVVIGGRPVGITFGQTARGDGRQYRNHRHNNHPTPTAPLSVNRPND